MRSCYTHKLKLIFGVAFRVSPIQYKRQMEFLKSKSCMTYEVFIVHQIQKYAAHKSC